MPNSQRPCCTTGGDSRGMGDSKVQLMIKQGFLNVLYSSYNKKRVRGRGVRGCLSTAACMKRWRWRDEGGWNTLWLVNRAKTGKRGPTWQSPPSLYNVATLWKIRLAAEKYWDSNLSFFFVFFLHVLRYKVEVCIQTKPLALLKWKLKHMLKLWSKS